MLVEKMKSLRILVIVFVIPAMALLAGCASPRQVTPPPQERLANGITVDRSIPDQIPDKSVRFPHAQYVLIESESAVELLSPIPFVADAVVGSLHKSTAEAYAAYFLSIDPFRIAQASLHDSPVMGKAMDGIALQPFVFVQECADNVYRISFVYHLHAGDWIGRYVVHLPTTYTLAEVKSPTPPVLTRLNGELLAASQQLRQMLERSVRGELKASGVKADIGSLYLLGGKAMGVLPTTSLYVKNADLIEEGPDHVIANLPGDMTAVATAGGLFFGTHYLRKDQLHTFTKRGGTP